MLKQKISEFFTLRQCSIEKVRKYLNIFCSISYVFLNHVLCADNGPNHVFYSNSCLVTVFDSLCRLNKLGSVVSYSCVQNKQYFFFLFVKQPGLFVSCRITQYTLFFDKDTRISDITSLAVAFCVFRRIICSYHFLLLPQRAMA